MGVVHRLVVVLGLGQVQVVAVVVLLDVVRGRELVLVGVLLVGLLRRA